MVLLKIVAEKPPIRLVQTSRNVKFCTGANKSPELDSINMAFLSYESPQAPAGDAAPPLVVMHGLLGCRRNWNSLCKLFHEKTLPQRKIISVDARNHGASPHSSNHTYPHLAEDVKTLLLRLNMKKAAVLGHSMGGRAMMYFALRYPELTDKLIVVDMSPVSISELFKSTHQIFTAMQKVNLPKNGPMSSARRIVDEQLPAHIKSRRLHALIVANIIQKSDGSYAWRVNIPALVANFSEHMLGFPDVSDLKFTGPVLFVVGGKSDCIPKTDHVHILKMFPNAEFREVDGAGHWVHTEKPQEVLQLVVEFLNRKATES